MFPISWVLYVSFWIYSSSGKIRSSPTVSISKVLQTPSRVGWLLWNICVTDDNAHVPIVITATPSSLTRLCNLFLLWVKRQVPLVEQDLFTLSGQLRSPTSFLLRFVMISLSIFGVLWAWFSCRRLMFYSHEVTLSYECSFCIFCLFSFNHGMVH